MKLLRLRISNFQSFGPEPTTIALDDLTYVLGPNGAGKTAVLLALARMFGIDPSLRHVQPSDFHSLVESGPDEESKELWIEADFSFPEAADEVEAHPTVPPFFAHMRFAAEGQPPLVRIRLTATIDSDFEVDNRIEFVLEADAAGVPIRSSSMPKHDRSSIQVHYLPARRDPADHISYATTSLLGRALRAANWAGERDRVSSLSKEITTALSNNDAINGIRVALGSTWSNLHSGDYFGHPAISFGQNDVEAVLRHLSISFSPAPETESVVFNRLSDGQKSLLYVSLVLSLHQIGRDAIAGRSTAFDLDRLRPAVFTLIAIEEPENSLSPHYLGRIIRAVRKTASENDAQAIIATHAPGLLRRVPPESIRYLRLNSRRRTIVRNITLPDQTTDAGKFVREGVQAFPELYFSRFVVLGEGDSEEIVLPRILQANGISEDDTSISVVPLGGRHVHHFWRLLTDLEIPYATLLDLDFGRHWGGWGRIHYAMKKLQEFSPNANVREKITPAIIAAIPKWDAETDLDGSVLTSWIAALERQGIFFSTPIDLDFMMLEKYPAAFTVTPGDLVPPIESTIKAVLGDSHRGESSLSAGQLHLFRKYQTLFKLGSKPAAHLEALSLLGDDTLRDDAPAPLNRLAAYVRSVVNSLPE
ncbi:ATP-dependent endonuclease [Cryobacterium sp. MDB2-10]|uniref:ATP-dependent nuclease n=1 Tax=Cryobacterium sp. MDB2-10 TaxID=1259177 RepID=UPI001073C097|nr:AAA family ATPase [Cryobacterium sp. MDB2-10]TFC19894.1 DUF2813 domain-containing protein [Cryobacterium sp. MDB2-10]